MIQQLIELLRLKVKLLTLQMNQNKNQVLYEAAKNALGTHQTLNRLVPSELGCAEAVSSICKMAGVKGIPTTGFAGTATLNDWLSTNASFMRISTPEPGAIIVSPTEGFKHGHTGFMGNYDTQYNKDWGVISNDSNTGIVREQWAFKSWAEYYQNKLGLQIIMYSYIG